MISCASVFSWSVKLSKAKVAAFSISMLKYATKNSNDCRE